MERLDDGRIALTQEELDSMQFFIRNTLRNEWDQHTNTFICTDSQEDGMRRMDPEMYDFAKAIDAI